MADNGVAFAGLMTAVQPAAKAGPALRVSMALGKFHGVIIARNAGGFSRYAHLAIGFESGDDFAAAAFGFFGKPFNKGGAVGDFAARFGQGFALFPRS